MNKIKEFWKKITTKENLPYFLSQVISLSFIFPFFAIIWTISFLAWAFNSPATVQYADWILSTHWLEEGGSSFLLVAFIWYLVTQFISVMFYIYFHFVEVTKFGTKYGSSLLIFNGFGYSQFLLIKKFIKKGKKSQKSKLKIKFTKQVLPRIAVVSIIPTQFALLGITFSHQTYVPTNLREIRLSSDPDMINVIEIFADGIDDYVFDVIDDSTSLSESFKDFTFYENFVTTGTNTMRSYNTLSGGFKNSMLWVGEEFGFEVLGDVVPERLYSVGLDNKYVLSPKFEVDKSGVIGSEETGDLIRTANWSQAKETYSGNFGTKYSPEFLKHKLARELWSHAPHGQSSHIMMADHLYHYPYSTTIDGELSFVSGTRESGGHATAVTLAGTVDSLKDFYGPAYDNSLILVYGDHGSHSLPLEVYGEGHDNMVKNRPMAAIKYPNATKSEFDVVSDRTLFSPLLQDIIANSVANPSVSEGTFIETDHRFDMDQTFFLERPEGLLLHSFRDGKLQSLENDSNVPWLNNNGWVDWEDVYGQYSDDFEREYFPLWYNDINFVPWNKEVYKGGQDA